MMENRSVTIDPDDPRWDAELPTCEDNVPVDVLRRLAQKCIAQSCAGDPSVAFPAGCAGHALYATIKGVLGEAGEMSDQDLGKVAAGALLALAQKGDYVP